MLKYVCSHLYILLWIRRLRFYFFCTRIYVLIWKLYFIEFLDNGISSKPKFGVFNVNRDDMSLGREQNRCVHFYRPLLIGISLCKCSFVFSNSGHLHAKVQRYEWK